MASLSAAHYGYIHQDLVTAYTLAALLLPRSQDRKVTIEKKVVDGDCFDDLEIAGHRRRRAQIKAHGDATRPLRLNDFTTNAISFRFDNAIRSFTGDATPADEYRLFATYGSPEESLLPFLHPAPSVPSLLPGLATQRFRLNLNGIWPKSQAPAWPHIEGFDRETVAGFCNRFVIEIGCPQSSGDLRSPGPLEYALLTLLGDRIGIGNWPNHNRDLADAAATLIYSAAVGRRASSILEQQNVIDLLALVINYGRVEERFPVDKKRLVQLTNTAEEIVAALTLTPRLALTGSPGLGKSWLVNQLASRLTADGWVVAVHYCFVDLLDLERSRRVSVETTFGSIMAELYDADPTLLTEAVPHYAAGPRELELLLDNAVREKPDRRIAIIVDGLDHADRVPGRSGARAAVDIAEELAILNVPPGIVLIVGSQPGNHLQAFLDIAGEYRLNPWPRKSIQLLAERMDVPGALRAVGLDGDIDRVLETIVEKADGSPLYATYLARTAVALAGHEAGTPAVGDIAEYLRSVPTFDKDLDQYYEWLIGGLAGEPGVLWIAELLSLLDFPISADELGEIRPDFRHHVPAVLSRLIPVLVEDVSRGGVRIYHESFQRYMRGRLEKDPNASIPAVLGPAVIWLDARGFFVDVRAFRSLLGLLRMAGRDDEVIVRITDDFVAQSAAHCQPADAVLGNLATAGASAAVLQNWATLGRLVEVSRAANYLYNWRLNDNELAEEYGRAYAEQFGAKALADRLLHGGRCTFPPRPGLILCQLCDQRGANPPWKEYRSAHDLQRRTNNASYGQASEDAVNVARLRGRLRLKGRERSIHECTDLLSSPERLPVHPADAAHLIGEMYGSDALMAVVEALPAGIGRAWARLALAQLLGDAQASRAQATAAIHDGLPQESWSTCLRAGADPQLFPKDPSRFHELTVKVISPGVEHKPEVLSLWLTEIELAAAVGDETALTGIQACIPSDTWFRRWLRFCVTLVRPSLMQEQLLSALGDLSENIEIFKGEPRVCDLYGLHGAIRGSFQDALARLDDGHWNNALHVLAQISTGTSTWVSRSRSGPLPVDALLDLCLATADTDAKRLAASTLGAELLAPGRRTHELYDTHAQEQLLLARLHASSGQRDLSEKAWLEACTYLAGYGHRKDITVYELLDPLKALARADSLRVRRCLRDVQPIVERILIHTDGRDTRNAIHDWLDQAARVHPAGALSYIADDEIGLVLSFGALDDTLPKALVALESHLNPIQVAAGWIAVGSKARTDPRAALLSAERLMPADCQLGRNLWNSLVAIIDGDGVRSVHELAELVAESAMRLGIYASLVTVAPPTGDDKPQPDTRSGAVGQEFSLGVPALLPASASSLQIAHDIRRWHHENGPKGDPERMINAVGWRLLEMLQAGDEDTAEALLLRLAHDTPPWYGETLLSGIAEGLALRGHRKLAALASTFAYTRGSDGWRRFAGPEGERFFLTALDLDTPTAWSILAAEVGDSVARGGEYGVTAHLIELLAASGRTDDAFTTWDAACHAVIFRVPATGPQDDIDPIYDPESDNPSDMLAATIVVRMNHCLIHEKRLAIAGAALMTSHAPLSMAAAVRLAVKRKAPPSTLITLLHVLEGYEGVPYEATQAAAADIRIIVEGEFVSARMLARQLLDRAGLSVPALPPTSAPLVVPISDDKAAHWIRQIGTLRVSAIEEIWPDFGRHVAARLERLFKSEELRERMQRTKRRIGTPRPGQRLQLWLPIDEEMERTVQTTGTAVRAALAQDGILDEGLEAEVGSRLLGDLDMSIRRTYSRTVRPTYFPSPTSLSAGSFITGVATVPAGEFTGWVIAAHHETEMVIGDRYPHPVTDRVTVYSGVEFGEARCPSDLPIGVGRLSIWTTPSSTDASCPFRGPLAGLNFVADLFGQVEILAPHPIVLDTHPLVPAPFYCGLSLLTDMGEAAVVCRTWRQRYIGDKELADEEPCLEGLQLLLRPDVFEAVSALAIESAKYVTVVTHAGAAQ